MLSDAAKAAREGFVLRRFANEHNKLFAKYCRWLAKEGTGLLPENELDAIRELAKAYEEGNPL